MPIKNLIACFFLIFSLSGCSYLYDKFVYQIDVTQGNYIDDDKLAKIELGMNQDQIIFLLGSPMMVDQFDSSKWYYIRYIKPGGEPVQQQDVILTFNNRVLEHIDSTGHIAENPLINNPNSKTAPNEAAESSSEDQESISNSGVPLVID